jgi:hypothetical protein
MVISVTVSPRPSAPSAAPTSAMPLEEPGQPDRRRRLDVGVGLGRARGVRRVGLGLGLGLVVRRDVDQLGQVAHAIGAVAVVVLEVLAVARALDHLDDQLGQERAAVAHADQAVDEVTKPASFLRAAAPRVAAPKPPPWRPRGRPPGGRARGPAPPRAADRPWCRRCRAAAR